MERSKGLILIVVGLAAALIIWQVGFKKSNESTTTPNQQNNSNTERPPRQPATGNVSEEPPAQIDRMATNTEGQNPRNANTTGRNQGRDNTNVTRNRNTQTALQNTGLKISIPEKMETAQLQILYNEYNRIRNAVFGGGRTGGRGGRTGGRGGMDMGMGGFGGMEEMMGGFGGGMMGGFGGDMTIEDMESMMEMMGGRGGMMGGMMGGGMDMGGMMDMMGGMDMGDNVEINPDETENNF